VIILEEQGSHCVDESSTDHVKKVAKGPEISALNSSGKNSASINLPCKKIFLRNRINERRMKNPGEEFDEFEHSKELVRLQAGDSFGEIALS
jgi:hypothetical protein